MEPAAHLSQVGEGLVKFLDLAADKIKNMRTWTPPRTPDLDYFADLG
jgi:hypothetical protein